MDILFQIREDCREFFAFFYYLNRQGFFVGIDVDDDDFDFALDVLKRYPVDTNVIFGPVGGTVKLEWLVDKVLKSGVDARVLPQLHKIIWGDKRAV